MNIQDLIVNNTPVERHPPGIYVKREDLSALYPLPPFSKVRGLVEVMLRLQREGIKVVGYTETSVSMAGIGVCTVAKALGMKAVIFDPQYKVTPDLLAYHRTQWVDAEIVPLKAGMARVNWNISRKWLKEKYGDKVSVLLPLGLPFPETIKAAADEVRRTREHSPVDFRTIVVNVGSGTVCAGVLKGFADKTVYGVMGRTGDVEAKKKKILTKAGFTEGGLFPCPDFHLIDEGYEYTESVDIDIPFPCHPWYDAKGMAWLLKFYEKLEPPILFWNIGALPADYKGE